MAYLDSVSFREKHAPEELANEPCLSSKNQVGQLSYYSTFSASAFVVSMSYVSECNKKSVMAN